MTLRWSRKGAAALGVALAWWLSADARGLEAWIASLRLALATLRRFPASGPRMEIAEREGARSMLVEPYRLVYVIREKNDEVWVMDVRHLRREPLPRLDLLK